MPFLAAAIVGLLAGIVAKLLTPGRDPGGFVVSASLGIVGAELATGLAHVAGMAGDDSAVVVGAAVGAAVIVMAIRLAPFRRRA